MQLYVAEKPSLARAIALALDAQPKRQQGAYLCRGDNVVTWCVGHLLELAEPEAYNPALKQWRLSDLPILPERWQHQVKPATREQFEAIGQWLQRAQQVVHAGDPDREGQRLVDAVLEAHGWHQPVQRVLINDMTASAIRTALKHERPNSEFAGLSASSSARAHADWLYGMNLSRLHTLLARLQGGKEVLSVGRVQTPLLGLIVARDRDIEGFSQHYYYLLDADFSAGDSHQVRARWQVPAELKEALDDQGRLRDRSLIEPIAAELDGARGEVTGQQRKTHSEAAPLPLSLSSLQIEANRRYQLSAQQVLDTCQSLYERHQLITYPRSDCRYLPETLLAQAPTTLQSIQALTAFAPDLWGCLNHAQRSAAWDDAKVGAHHAIIPTQKRQPSGPLSPAEQQVYSLIALFYLAQFMPAAVSEQQRLNITLNRQAFLARSTQIQAPGWKPWLLQHPPSADAPLPDWPKGTAVTCTGHDIVQRKTQPPSRFTHASLISAMTGIARFVSDPDVKKVLRDTDGLGTEATRAGMIETLLKRGFITQQGRHLISTPLGRHLIDQLPAMLTRPDLTAQWEAQLEQIVSGNLSAEAFTATLIQSLKRLIWHSMKADPTRASTEPPCPQCGARTRLQQGRYGQFHACVRYPACQGSQAAR